MLTVPFSCPLVDANSSIWQQQVATSGNWVWGPPRDVDAAIAVLREAVAAGVNHIDTSDYYGPYITNQIIKQALHPYPNGLVIVTKVGARRGDDKSWIHALSRQELVDAVHDNLRNLGLDALDVVNLRVGGVIGPSEGSIEQPLTVLAELKHQGLIRHLGLSNVTPAQLAEAQTITEIVCVQNFYNVAHRNDDAFIKNLAHQGIVYVPFLEGSLPCSPRRSTPPQPHYMLRPCRLRWRGFSSAHPTSC